MDTIKTHEAANMILDSKGKLFGVTFIKRSTGTSRRMTARTGVTKGVTGEGKRFNPKDHGLLTVHEFVGDPETERENGKFVGNGNIETHFRHIPIEGITELKMGGKTFQVIQ